MAIQERLLQQLLAQFVDREVEMRRFCEMLESDIKHIMLVWGESGMGKSWLLQKMMHECAQRSIRKSKVTWTDTSSYDYMWTMRAIRDDLNVGEAFFQSFNDRINQYTDEHYSPQIPAQVVINVTGAQSILDQGVIRNSTVGEIAGTIVKDNMFMIPRSDLTMSVKELQIKLTDTFMKDLTKVVSLDPVVVFFDAAEKMSPDTENWIWDELLRAVFEERIQHVKFVLCGQRRRELPNDWNLIVEEAELRPLTKPDIVEYLSRRGVSPEQRDIMAEWLLANTKGRIKDIALQAENYIRWKEAQGTS